MNKVSSLCVLSTLMLVGSLLSACSERTENKANIDNDKTANMAQETSVKDDLGQPKMQKTENQSAKPITLRGKILFQDIEGGFFGFISEDGKKYTPRGMRREHLRHGLVIEMIGQILPNVMTITQFGEVIKVEVVTVLDDSNALDAGQQSTNQQDL